MAMRVSTLNIYNLGINSVRQNQADLVKLQQQISSGRRVLTPADDPVASAQILQVDQASALNEQFKINGQNARSAVSLSEGYLQSVVTLLQNVKTQAVYAGNPTLTQSDRAALLSELDERYKELLGLANAQDGNGQYLYSGYQGNTKPFDEVAPGQVVYLGDQGQRQIQISPSRALPVSESGRDVYQRIKEGNGTFVGKAPSPNTNTGNGIIAPGTVKDLAKWQAAAVKDYTIVFEVNTAVTPNVTRYDITETATGNSVFTGAPPVAGAFARVFQPNAAIDFKRLPGDPGAVAFDVGIQTSIDGAPATGDKFTIKASQDKQIFDTMTQFANLLKLQKDTPANAAFYQNELGQVMQSVENAITNITSVQADIGTRQKEVESVRDTLDDLQLQYATQKRDLGDLDYAQAISDFALTQTFLEAAQKTFLQTQKLSLFEQI
ncbi:flagellar hook-associated protein 3 FlgL [Chitinivorax tropicus]|uniref:Flagellar hook-associated protein 3 FlgL n=1 Tax=Chitinivorax tropicus TaxID=714531 RepID=A0A840MMP5_9PROT|nr:flagellar hook-associated protein FlgL [Chitinivorax tropicus]MBB5018735.1 flagellar hook-associated protein 3 FlgL [Chitinivorax tropicus]